MTTVVVDEGLWILALAAETDPGVPHEMVPHADDRATASEVVQELQVSAVWVLTHDINTIYWNRINGAAYKGTLWSRLRTSLVGVLADSERTLWLDEWEVVEGQYDHDDDCWVGAAAMVGRGCLLITVDRRLITALNQNGIPQANDFVVMHMRDMRHQLVQVGAGG